MDMITMKRGLLVGVCVALLPASVMARDYLKGQTSYKPFEDTVQEKGDFAADYEYTEGSGGDFAKRQRVESRVRQYMEDLKNAPHDDSDHVTAENFAELVAKAQGGDAKAISGVGYAYQHGEGVEKNEKLALEWYKRAIEYGETQNYARIGEMYRDYSAAGNKPGFMQKMRNAVSGGGGSPNDLADDNAEAVKWFEKGAAMREWNAYMKLGEMYRDGTGVTKNMDKANWYYNEGLRMRKAETAAIEREIEQAARAQAEIEEGLREPGTPVTGGNAQAGKGTVLGDYYCSLLQMDSPTVQYKTFYEAYCEKLGEGSAANATAPQTVVVDGMTCDVTTWPANTTGKDFELRCR